MDYTTAPTDAEKLSIWTFVHKEPRFTYAQIATACPIGAHKRSEYLAGLRRAGIIRECARKGTKPVYTVLDEAAAQTHQKQKRESHFGRMWQAMRSLKVFTADDILLSISTDDETLDRLIIGRYCTHILAAGYLKVAQRARPKNHTRGARLATYQLIKNTGPLPPVITRKEVVIDSNEERAVHVVGVIL
jgi:hypothetical protein